MVGRVTPRIRAPIIMFTYYNPIMRRGLGTFCAQLRDAGVRGAAPVHAHVACSVCTSHGMLLRQRLVSPHHTRWYPTRRPTAGLASGVRRGARKGRGSCMMGV